MHNVLKGTGPGSRLVRLNLYLITTPIMAVLFTFAAKALVGSDGNGVLPMAAGGLGILLGNLVAYLWYRLVEKKDRRAIPALIWIYCAGIGLPIGVGLHDLTIETAAPGAGTGMIVLLFLALGGLTGLALSRSFAVKA